MNSLDHMKLGWVTFWVVLFILAMIALSPWLLVKVFRLLSIEEEVRNNPAIEREVTPDIPKENIRTIPEKGKG